MTTVPELLRSGADTYEERNKIYGDNYKRHGEVMLALFPNGVKLDGIDDHNRFGLLTQKVAKLTRYCENFNTGGHSDSLHDDMVYTAMLAEVDAEIATFPTEDEAPSEAHPGLEITGNERMLIIDPLSYLGQPVHHADQEAVVEPSELPEQSTEADEASLVLDGEPADPAPPAVIPEPPVQK